LDATRKNIRRRLAIVIDDEVQSAPVILSEISGGTVMITMAAGAPKEQLAEARQLAAALRRSIPAPNEPSN